MNVYDNYDVAPFGLQGDAQVRGRWIRWIRVRTLVIVKRAQLVVRTPRGPSLPPRSLDGLTVRNAEVLGLHLARMIGWFLHARFWVRCCGFWFWWFLLFLVKEQLLTQMVTIPSMLFHMIPSLCLIATPHWFALTDVSCSYLDNDAFQMQPRYADGQFQHTTTPLIWGFP